MTTCPTTCDVLWTPGAARVRVPTDAPLLFSLLSAGLELDFGCMYGLCRACRAHVAAGRVRHGDESRLTPEERRAGHALLCAAYPDSAVLHLSPAEAISRRQDWLPTLIADGCP